jgi:uncharacterized protein with NRDE domain
LCLILFAYQAHDKYKLIVAANRDEFYERPTAPVHFWEDYPNILAGRDLLKMGTWMGVTATGRFAALTNYRDPKEQSDGKRSRGELPADFLKDNEHPEIYMYGLAKKRNLYPGYNSNRSLDERILNLLQKADPAPDEMLPHTGVALDWERILSPIFIKSEGYGTRSSTVLLISDEEISVREMVYSHDGMKDHQFSLPIQ